MDTASCRKMEDEKKEPVKLEEKLNRLEKEFCLPRVLISRVRTVLCRSDIEGDLNKAMQQLKEFKETENSPIFQGSPQRSENNRKGRLNPPNTLPKPKNRGNRGQSNNFLEKENQGTLIGDNEEDSNFEPSKLLVCGLRETTTHDEILNFIEVTSGEEVQNVQISKGKALVTMTKDITSK